MKYFTLVNFLPFNLIFKIYKWLGKPFLHKAYSILTLIENNYFYKIYKIRGFDFDGNISNNELVADSKYSLDNANSYLRSQIIDLKAIIYDALSTEIKFDTFLDVGCGKGLACIFVAENFNFKKISGFDFSLPLIQIANKNLLISKNMNIHFSKDDATDFIIPEGNTLVFIFNSFNEIILQEFIGNNLQHFARNNSIIAYFYDLHWKILSNYGFECIYRPRHSRYSLWRLPNICIDKPL